MAHKGGKQNEATRRATRRNYALFQAMGMRALVVQIRELALSMPSQGYDGVEEASRKTDTSLQELVNAIEAWDPNKGGA